MEIHFCSKDNVRDTLFQLSRLVRDHLVLEARWSTITSLSSDHLPIAISLDALTPTFPTPKKTFINYKKANWEGYTKESETIFSSLPPPSSCSAGERPFREAILRAAQHNIPRGFRANFRPGVSAETTALVGERDALRRENPTSPRVRILDEEVSRAIAADTRRAWTERVEGCSLKYSSARFWTLLRSLSGKKSAHSPNQYLSLIHI